MNILAEKIELVKLLLDIENPKIIESIKRILKKETTPDFWDELSVEQRDEIEKATLEIEKGEVTDYEMLQKRLAAHKNGRSKSFTWDEVKENARKALE